MKELPFSIPVSGIVQIDGDSVKIVVNRAETTVSLETKPVSGKRIALQRGLTLNDIVLETARELVRTKGFNRFSAPELYRAALEKYPELKRNSFMTRVIACTPNHTSYEHYTSRRDYLTHIGPGLYWLNEEYIEEKSSDKEKITGNQ
jgi:hypothetical protein